MSVAVPKPAPPVGKTKVELNVKFVDKAINILQASRMQNDAETIAMIQLLKASKANAHRRAIVCAANFISMAVVANKVDTNHLRALILSD